MVLCDLLALCTQVKGQDMKCAICGSETSKAMCDKCASGMQSIIEEGIAGTFTIPEEAANGMKFLGEIMREGTWPVAVTEQDEPDTFAKQYGTRDIAIRGLSNAISFYWPETPTIQMLHADNIWRDIEPRKALLLLEENILHTFRYGED